MKASIETETNYRLVLDLNENEAHELLGYVQNYHGEEGQESADMARVRAHIFDALRKVLSP